MSSAAPGGDGDDQRPVVPHATSHPPVLAHLLGLEGGSLTPTVLNLLFSAVQ